MSSNDAELSAKWNSKKWTCLSCTYENFPKSIKCSICLTPNQSSNYLIEDIKNDDSNELLKKNINNDLNKWNCLSCTYENFPKSIKCSICSAAKPSQISNIINEDLPSNSKLSASSSSDDLIKLNNLNKIKNNLNNDFELKQIKDNPSTSKRIDLNNDNSDNSTSSSNNSLNNSLNNSINIPNNDLLNDNKLNDNKLNDNLQTINCNSKKWTCLSCTYENFPKSIKCSICLTAKPSTDNVNIQSAINSSSSINNDLNCLNDKITTTQSTNYEQHFERNIPSPIGATCQRKNRINNLNNVNTITNYNRMRKNRDFVDLNWLEACIGILNGDPAPVLIYLNNGGDLGRQLTHVEVNLLNKQTLVGYTLVHLAIRFKRSEILEILLENRTPNRAKRVPCSVSINYGSEVRKLVNHSLKQRKGGDFQCYFVSEFVSFTLPQEILELPPNKQESLFEDLLDKEVMNELEESSIINWSLEINVTLGSRLYVLWNRSSGDCLLDSALQSTYGCFDKDNRLRKALADSLNDSAQIFFSRFKEAETLKVNHQLPYTLDNMQWHEDWAIICSIASQPGSALEKFHIFVLSHILRRPIIVYSVKFVKGLSLEKLALADFEGIYLPLHWNEKFCSKSPIALAYTKGHFSSLVPMSGISNCVMMSCNCNVVETNQSVTNNECKQCCVNGASKNNIENDCCYLPLVTSERELLPLQFLVEKELNRQEEIMRQYLDCCLTEEGTLVCKQKITKRPYSCQQMINEWIDFYRNMPVVNCNNNCKLITTEQTTNVKSNGTNDTTNYISDEDSD